MGLKQILSKVVSGLHNPAKVQPNADPAPDTMYGEEDEDMQLGLRTSPNRTQHQIDSELDSLSASLDGLGGNEFAYRHCTNAFDAKFFEQDRDSDYKSALVLFLNTRYPNRNALWRGMQRRDNNVLHLL